MFFNPLSHGLEGLTVLEDASLALRQLCSRTRRRSTGWRALRLSSRRRESRGSSAVTSAAAGRARECSLDLRGWAQRCGFAAWLGPVLSERPGGKSGGAAQPNRSEDVWGICSCSLFALSPVAGLSCSAQTSSRPVAQAQAHPATL